MKIDKENSWRKVYPVVCMCAYKRRAATSLDEHNNDNVLKSFFFWPYQLNPFPTFQIAAGFQWAL